MIRSWADRKSQRFYEQGKRSSFRGMDAEAAEELLAVLDAAVSLQDLSPLKSVGLHKLKGDRKGQWAMTANGPWRICFRFRDGDAYGVAIVDYHKG
jgi:proteic killer suppression protein